MAPPGDGRPGALAWEDDVWEDDVWEDDWDKARLGGRRKRQVQDSAQAVTTDNVTLSAHTKPFPGVCTHMHRHMCVHTLTGALALYMKT